MTRCKNCMRTLTLALTLVLSLSVSVPARAAVDETNAHRLNALGLFLGTGSGSPAATPIGMAPRSSTTGTIAIKKVIASFPNTLSPKIIKNASATATNLLIFVMREFLLVLCRPEEQIGT